MRTICSNPWKSRGFWKILFSFFLISGSTFWNIQTRRYLLAPPSAYRDTFMNDIGVALLEVEYPSKTHRKGVGVSELREYSKMNSDFVWMPNSQITHDYNSQPKPIFKKKQRPLPHPKKTASSKSKKSQHITNQKGIKCVASRWMAFSRTKPFTASPWIISKSR